MKMHMNFITISIITTFFFLVISISTTNAATNQTQMNQILAKQFLGPHNVARCKLKLKPLVWDLKLSRYAQWYANKRKYDCDLRHSDGPYGENIFWGSGNGWSPAQAVAAWVSEKKWYSYWLNSCVEGEECGHYTQIVWRSTIRIGCAKVTCSGGKGVFITCNYDPPGNYMGERPY